MDRWLGPGKAIDLDMQRLANADKQPSICLQALEGGLGMGFMSTTVS